MTVKLLFRKNRLTSKRILKGAKNEDNNCIYDHRSILFAGYCT